MKTFYQRTIVLMTVATAAVVVRTGLPPLVTWLANFAFRRISGVRGRVRRVGISFIAPGLTVNGISLAARDFPEQRIEASSIVLTSQWKDLLRGALVATVSVKAPRFLVNANGFASAQANNGKPKKPSSDRDDAPPWQ